MNFEKYVVSGRFAADAAELELDNTELATASLPSDAFAAQLPAEAREALGAIVKSLHEGTFPDLAEFEVSEHSWAFDFKAHGVKVLDSDFEGDLSGEVFAMAGDGSGNRFCLATDGRVVIWNHEEKNIEDHSQFPSLDEALYALMFFRACMDDHEKYTGEVKQVFEEKAAAGENGWSFLLEMLLEDIDG